MCGPLIGGYFVSGGNWRGAFWAFAFQGLVAVLVAPPLLRRQFQTQNGLNQRMPLARLGLLGVSVLAICQAGVVRGIVRTFIETINQHDDLVMSFRSVNFMLCRGSFIGENAD